jgi:transcriptional regulator with XRE-family HTH domain
MATNKAAGVFGREVRRRRHAQGMTLDALSAGVGLTPQYIGSIEAGQRDPSLSSMVKLASGLGAPLGELLGVPEMAPDAIEGARLLSALPSEMREPMVEALRALARWGEGMLACSGS